MSNAEGSMLLKLFQPDIQGESKCCGTTMGHRDEIDISAYDFGASVPVQQPSGGGGGTLGPPNINELRIVKEFDKASIGIFEQLLTNRAINTVEFCITSSTAIDKDACRVKYTLSNAIVSSQRQTGEASEPIPTEVVSFVFSRILIEYRVQDSTGNLDPPISFGWDVETNREL